MSTGDSRASDTIDGEAAIIDLLRPLATDPAALGLADDCAALSPRPGMDIVLKTDPIAEGVHFLAGDAPEAIAWKALAVNVSDLAAKAARPLGYLMALSFPAPPRRAWLQDFAAGLKAAQDAFGMTLLGGDTDRRPGPITVSITVLGEAPKGRMVRRATAQPGDVLFVSGSIGDAGLGLQLCQTPRLAEAWGLEAAQAAFLRRRYHRPEPRLALREALRAAAGAAMDVSDGLVKDLGRMAAASHTSAEIRLEDVPLSAPARAVLAVRPELHAGLVAAGDDYEVLAAVPEGKARDFAELAARAGVEVGRIGRMLPDGDGAVSVLDRQGSRLTIERSGWDHF